MHIPQPYETGARFVIGGHVHVGEVLPDAARNLLTDAGLSPERFDEEQARAEADEEIARAEAARSVATVTELDVLLRVLAVDVHRGDATPNLRQAYVTYAEAVS